jgi:DNA-binding HxlR family transcriptional regulator
MARSVEKDTAAPRARRDRLDCSSSCGIGAALLLTDGKWKGVVQEHLMSGRLRFSQICRLLSSVTQCMLTTG